MAYQPIENYGIIGNMRTVALVGMNGSIDWYCYPHFDSPSIFGAILDDKKGGHFQISADSDGVRHKQFYWPSTNVLVTRIFGRNCRIGGFHARWGCPLTYLHIAMYTVAFAASGERCAFRSPAAQPSIMGDRRTRP